MTDRREEIGLRTLHDAACRLSRAMYAASGGLLGLMMLTVLADIVTRSLFGTTGGAVDLTFRGAVEIVRYGLLFAILFALPHAVDRGQVIVDLFTQHLSARAKAILGGVYTFVFGLFGIAMAVRFHQAAERTMASGETTQDLIIPMAYVYMVSLFAAVVLGLRGVLAAALAIVRGGRGS